VVLKMGLALPILKPHSRHRSMALYIPRNKKHWVRRVLSLGLALPIFFALLLILLVGCSQSEQADSSEHSETSLQLDTAVPRASAASAVSEPQCASSEPLRQAFFGDVHIHTAYSMDAYTSDVRMRPEDAYRFARGEPIALTAGRTAQLERPLDFAAVSDHAEYLGEVSLCTTPGSTAYHETRCAIYRGENPAAGRGARMGVLLDQVAPFVTLAPFPALGTPVRSPLLCGDDFSECRKAATSVWAESQAATERMHDDSPSCEFTAFHAYEYTWTPQLSKIHRNVIFRNATVLETPVTSVEASPRELWETLQEECLDADNGCDVLAIPHNPNLSNGRMFKLDYLDAPLAEQPGLAALQARLEPLVEVLQVKGDSECRNGFADVLGGADEFCEFEKFRPAETEDCGEGTGIGALGNSGCIARRDFVRYALIDGLKEQSRIGVNPLKLGFSASTDSHNGSPGDTEEYSYDGAHASSEESILSRLRTGAGDIVEPTAANPGGLFGIWAEENSRDSLFDAMQRKETFGTSGVRIQPRFFGGWSFEPADCEAAGIIERGDEIGVRMGSDLPSAPGMGEGSSETPTTPSFLVTAAADPGTPTHPGGLLERIQIVKGWVGDDGAMHQAVHDVALSDETGGAVDVGTCSPPEGGARTLCGVWRDPEFDPARPAVYYSRVLERPSCRWTGWHCLALPVAERPPACSDPAIAKEIRERAWTSPIWYTPS
jgi:hypothetical protein